MQQNAITVIGYAHPLIEGYLSNLSAELTDFAAAQSMEDAQRTAELSETAFTAKVANPVREKVQAGIDLIRQTLLPTSRLFDTSEIALIAEKKIQQIANSITDKRQHLGILKRKRDAIGIDQQKLRYGRWFMYVAIAVAVADGALAYAGFRHGGYSIIMAFITATAIAGIIATSHLFYCGWIIKAATNRQKFLRIAAILAIALIFFSLIGNMRATALNSTVDVRLTGNTATASDTASINGWAISIVSFVLFSGVLFLALRFWRTKQERLAEEEYTKLQREIQKTDRELKTLEQERQAIEATVTSQKSEARILIEYAGNSIRKCKNIGKAAIIAYQQNYARYRDGVVPSFFERNFSPSYDEGFQFYQSPKPEHV